MTLQSGDVVGQYQIIGPLGQGGMAAVFKAYHPQLDRHVAIKFIHQTFLEDASFIARFQREAKIIARLDHPNIVPVYDYSEYNKQPYLVMKYIEGQTLRELMTEMPMPEMLDVMSSVADGLTYAHNQGVLHRDIKPGNIIVDNQKRPYITDFGLARIVQSGQSTLSQDMLLGTPHYVSPEQAKGIDNLGPPADIYSLGVVLYEIAVGRVPFSGNTPYAIVHDHIYSPLPRPSDLNDSVSPQVEDVLMKALAKEPSERYHSATELVNAFREAQLSTPQTAKAATTVARQPEPPPVPAVSATLNAPATAITQPQKAGRSRLWIIGLPALLVLVVIVVGLVSLRGQNRPGPTEPAPPTATIVATRETITPSEIPDNVPEETQQVEQNSQTAEAYLALAKAAWLADRAAEAQAAIVDGVKVADDPVAFYLSAAEVADEVKRIPAAMIMYSRALTTAQSNNDIFPEIRAIAGEYLYYQSLELVGVDQDSMQKFQQAFPDFQPHPLLTIMGIHFPLMNGRVNLAELGFRRLPESVANLAEARLVLGEIHQAQDDDDKAKIEWEAIAGITDAPEWVKQRAEELLRSITGG